MAADSSDWDGRSSSAHEAHLAEAYEHLSTVLEGLDLERDQEFADQVIGALMETERAYTAAVKASDRSDRSVAPLSED